MEHKNPIFSFQNEVTLKDMMATDYLSHFQRRTPIVIDNGKSFNNSDECTYFFRVSSLFLITIINNFDTQVPPLSLPYFNKFLKERLFNYVFAHLGIDTASVEHPVLLTEAVCNPNYSRKG